MAKLRKNQIFKHNWAPNYSSVRKIHVKRLDFSTKRLFSGILKFFILKGGKCLSYEKFRFSLVL